MGILLGFAPFLVFAVLTRFTSAAISLWAAALVSAILVLRERVSGKSAKILEVGTFALFALLGLYSFLSHSTWDIPIIRSMVDAGLFLIIVISLLGGRPFTLQYARERVPPELHNSPQFLKTNYAISAVWALAMGAIVVADLAMHFIPSVPVRTEILVIVAALGGAYWFTNWYPQQRKGHRT